MHNATFTLLASLSTFAFISCSGVPKGSVKVDPPKQLLGSWKTKNVSSAPSITAENNSIRFNPIIDIKSLQQDIVGMLGLGIKFEPTSATYSALGFNKKDTTFQVYQVPAGHYQITGVGDLKRMYYYPKKKALYLPDSIKADGGHPIPVWMYKE